MISPTIHMNGTSAGDLLEQTSDARAALRTAIRKLELAAPNASRAEQFAECMDRAGITYKAHLAVRLPDGEWIVGGISC